jgi:hypothetical protein
MTMKYLDKARPSFIIPSEHENIIWFRNLYLGFDAFRPAIQRACREG